MVSLTTLLTVSAAVLRSPAAAAGTPMLGSRADTPCGRQASGSILSPANGTTIVYTAEASEGYSLPIIYCSGEYFKTSSINVTAILTTGDASTPLRTGEILGSAEPSDGAAAPGYYGYVFNVAIYSTDGPHQLGIFEWSTGYYNSYNYELSAITINLEKAPTA